MSTRGQVAVYELTLPLRLNEKREVVDKIIRGWCKHWCYQLEEGDDGYRHWQIHVSLIKKRRLQEILPKLKVAGLVFGRMSPLSLNGLDSIYCMKEDTRIEGPWTDKDKKPRYVQKRFREPQPKAWQEKLKYLVQSMKGNDRNIILVQDDGGEGKSWFKGWMLLNEEVVVLPSTLTTANEMIEFLCSCPEIEDGWEGVILMDVPRSTSPKHWYTLAAGLECIKQGFLHDKRYRARKVTIEPPQMICFCNQMPPQECMTRDVFKVFDKNAEFPRAGPA